MNDIIEYRPYRSHYWFVYFILGIGILAFVFVGYCLPHIGFDVFLFLAIGIISFWLTKVLYDTSNISILFEQEGLRIIGGRYNNYRYVRWEELAYAYYDRNYKGHLFLLLSPKDLNQKQAKRFINRAANTSKICVDFVIVIHIDAVQDTSRLKELINNNVSHTVEY